MSSRPLIRALTNTDLDAQEEATRQSEAANRAAAESADMPDLAAYIRKRFQEFKLHRSSGGPGWNQRLLDALNAFNGQYSSGKLEEIKKFGGSEVYARITAQKCRGASSLLRDVYLGPDRSWSIQPPSDPDIPENIIQAIRKLVITETSQMVAQGQRIDTSAVQSRVAQLLEGARDAAKKKAAQQASIAEDKIDEILVQGNFYRAFGEFITDIPIFPFAVIKGPIVRMIPSVLWKEGRAIAQQLPRLYWLRVSPFDIWWTPGVSNIADADVVERTRLTRADLNDLLDLPGYNQAAVRQVLDDYGRGGLSDNWDYTDSERASLESKENPVFNTSGMISCLEFHGNVQGRMLIEFGLPVKDPLRDYFVQAWLIDRFVIKVQLSPSPRKRHPYFSTSFEKVPGTVVGNGLTDMLADVQDVGNAVLRALVNNVSIASGPQVVVNDDRIAPGEDGEELYPWKRWHVSQDPMNARASAEKPVDFFQPQSNAQEMMSIFSAIQGMADDASAIPRYLEGSSAGGAGRTSSGLAMLLGNASKVLQTVAANIDNDVLQDLLQSLFDMIMLTDTSGLLTGEEKVRVMGVSVAVQKETQRSRQLEFLQATANPLDAQIIGPEGRAVILREVSKSLGLPGQDIVPDHRALAQQQQVAAEKANAEGAPGHVGLGDQAGQAAGGQPTPPNGQQGPRTAIAGGAG